MAHCLLNMVNNLRELKVDLVLEEPQDMPTLLLKTPSVPAVAIDILRQLSTPEVVPAARAQVVERTSVPEATIDKDGEAGT